jgi:hypothetical protein
LNIIRDVRPFGLAAACTPLAVAPVAQAYALGQPAVQSRVTNPAFWLHAGLAAREEINNYNGITSAKGAGMATSIEGRSVSATRIAPVQVDQVKGGDARGIPPRGTPV